MYRVWCPYAVYAAGRCNGCGGPVHCMLQAGALDSVWSMESGRVLDNTPMVLTLSFSSTTLPLLRCCTRSLNSYQQKFVIFHVYFIGCKF